MKHNASQGKLLRHAILLSLAFSTVWGTTAMASEFSFEGFIGETPKEGTITVTEDTIVNSHHAGTSSYLEPKDRIGDYHIELAQGAMLELNDLNMYNTHITGTNNEHGGNIVININGKYSNGGAYGGGLIAGSAALQDTEIKANDLTITNKTSASLDKGWYADGIFVGQTEKGNMNVDLTGKLSVSANYHGITTEGDTYSALTFKADSVSISAGGWGVFINGNSRVDMTATNNINIHGEEGISNNSPETLNFISKNGNIAVRADTLYGVTAEIGDIKLTGKNNWISVEENSKYTGYAVRSKEGNVFITADTGNNFLMGGTKTSGVYSTVSDNAGVILKAKKSNIITVAQDGAYAHMGNISLNAGENNIITAGQAGLKADVDGIKSSVTAAAQQCNVITAGDERVIDYDGQEITFGGSVAAEAKESGQVSMQAGTANVLSGAVYASGTKNEMKSAISVGGFTNEDGAKTTNPDNFIYSAAVISDAGDLNQDTATDNNMSKKQVISALYAEDGAAITVSGQSNTFRTTANPNNSKQLERVIWAYNGADITVDGTTTISTDSYKESPNSADIAIAAGTAVNLTKDAVDYAVANPDNIDHAVVAVNYDSYADNEGNTVASSITGDIVSAYAGQVNIKKQDGVAENAEINIEGNLLAGNGGSLQVDLGKGGLLTGRVDDYGDAGSTDEKGEFTEGHATFFDPAFSSTIYKGGNISLDMGDGSVWDVTGQSWLTSLSGNGTVDMRNTNSSEEGDSSHAVHIGKLSGDHTFIMDLNADKHDISDMLYIYDTAENSTQKVQFKNITGWEGMEDGEKLRFATVNADTTELKFTDANATQITYLRDLGVNDMGFEIQNEKVTFTDESKDEENEGYNGESLNGDKPGNASVEENYNQANSLNWYLIKNSAEDTLSDAGQTVIDMSRVNYSNAVYMDRLNKRMGEARYIEGDDGLWVRLRHDRIGRADAFRSMNTMFELGYDRKVQAQKDGEHRRGVAFDYMRGEANYTNVMGSGDVRRAGVWLYDTWLGDKGHYSDYVLKYGRLSNDFDIFARTSGNKISGDYDNDVWSASAEYGRKKDIGNEWYFEPQAQLQYAYVTSADYTTSQGTRVELDGIDSLIGRAGFRLGRDTSEGNTVYFKADILHEFLGDQSIRAMDDTGVLSTTYDNEGTWYDVGLGFSHRMGEDSHMFLDVEHSFGNDNEDTYQINIGLNKAF